MVIFNHMCSSWHRLVGAISSDMRARHANRLWLDHAVIRQILRSDWTNDVKRQALSRFVRIGCLEISLNDRLGRPIRTEDSLLGSLVTTTYFYASGLSVDCMAGKVIGIGHAGRDLRPGE